MTLRAVPRTDDELLGIAYEHDPRYYLWTLIDQELYHGDVPPSSRIEAFRMLAVYTRDVEGRYWALQQKDPLPRAPGCIYPTPVRRTTSGAIHGNGTPYTTWGYATSATPALVAAARKARSEVRA